MSSSFFSDGIEDNVARGAEAGLQIDVAVPGGQPTDFAVACAQAAPGTGIEEH